MFNSKKYKSKTDKSAESLDNSLEVKAERGFTNKKVPRKIVFIYMVFLVILTLFVLVRVEGSKMSGLSTYAKGPLFEVIPSGEILEKNQTQYFAPTITIREVSNLEVVKLKLANKPLLSNKKMTTNTANYKNLSATLDMEASKKNALAASIALNGGVKSETNVVISNIDEEGPAYRAGLRIGMSILEINGQRVHQPEEIVSIARRSQNIEVKTLQSETVFDVKLEAGSLGLKLITAPSGKLPSIDVVLNKVGGSSAGLVMGLAIYDSLTPGRLTKLSKVSGSGQITADGRIFPIEGIEEKLAAAQASGVEVFFLSKSQEFNYKGTQMKVVKVSNLKEAVAYLRNN